MTLPECLLASPALPLAPRLTVAFSGGADSTALLLCLYRLREPLGLTDLQAVHVHHGIRGAEADRDAAFCAAFCRQHGIPFTQVNVDVPAYAATQKCSVETAARILRYEALSRLAGEGDLATAHHAADNAETLLFHLMRGCGTKGLCGMQPRSGHLVRPLLYAEKDMIRSYLRENGQDFVEDSTNALDDSSRNRIRHDLLPRMQAENPAVIAHLNRTASLLSADEALLSAMADTAYAQCRDMTGGGFHGLAAQPAPIRMRMYMRRLAEYRIDPSYDLLQRIDSLLHTDGKICISGDVYAQSARGILYIAKEPAPLSGCHPLQTGANALYPERVCYAILAEPGTLSRNNHKSNTRHTLDFDKIEGSPYFRQWQAEDTIQLPARTFHSSLKKCIQQAVPPPERRTLFALYDDQGCIWCERIGIAARVRPDADTRQLLLLSAELLTTNII